jgi:RNA polymerase sigma factor (sigma-70 family)
VAGDQDAFDRLYRQYRPGLMGFVLRQVGDHHMAEDIVQETFLVAWRDLAKLRDPAAIRTWLFSIAYRRAMSAATRVRHTPLPDDLIADEAPGRRPDLAAEQREAVELVWAAAHGLAPRQRAVLELSVRWDLSSREIGEVLGVGTAHAAVLVHRSRAALGSAVLTTLVARQQGRCAGLDAIAHGNHRLTARQRSRVDHHISRCEQCRRLRTRVSAYTVLGLLLLAAGSVPPGAPGHQPRLVAARTGLRWAVRLTCAAALTGVLGIGGYVLLPGRGDIGVPSAASAPGGIVATGSASPTRPTPTASAQVTPSATAAPSAAPRTSPQPTKAAPSTLEQEMLALVNQARKNAGCGAVHNDSRLAKAALGHSTDMAKRDYFSHETPEGVTPWDRARAAGYTQPSGENIAAGNTSAKATFQQWMNSPGHRANILNCDSKAMGVGRAAGASYRYYWTQMFGFR